MRLRVFAAASLILLSACTSTKQHAATDFKPPSGAYKVVVMRPSVNVSLLTAGGMLEPREDWSRNASEFVLAELQALHESRGGTARIVSFGADDVGDLDLAARLDRLHEAVGRSILLHKYAPGLGLPTKANSFDWTLGQLAVDYGKASGQDYALFLFAEASYSSTGQLVLQAVAYIGCVVGVCFIPPTAQQTAFVSLVDLETGDIVWYNRLVSTISDIRTPEGAHKLVEELFEDLKPTDVQGS